MSSLTISLYICSGVVIGLLTAFAAHNRKVGWKKSRTTLTEALDDLYSDLGLNPAVAEAEPLHQLITRKVATRVDPADFSGQLIRLKSALGESTPVPASEPKAQEREMVQVQVR
jgi:hypothetical protein